MEGGADFSLSELCGLVAAQLQYEGEVMPGLRLVEDLGCDSLEMQALLLSVEERCGRFPDAAALQAVSTVADLFAAL